MENKEEITRRKFISEAQRAGLDMFVIEFLWKWFKLKEDANNQAKESI